MQAHSSSVTCTCTSIQDSLESFAEQNLKKAVQEWQTELSHTSDRVGKFSTVHGDKLGKAKEVVDKYITHELKQDVPTGR